MKCFGEHISTQIYKWYINIYCLVKYNIKQIIKTQKSKNYTPK
jgi:hypothetical protein